MRWHLALARSLAWALLLGGWVGLAALAQRFSANALSGFGLLALWLAGLGVFAGLLGHVAWGASARRAVLIACGALAAAALGVTLGNAPAASLVVAALAWAAVVALASVTVRACRLTQTRRPGAPVVPAALGALLAWLWLGDIGAAALPWRLALGLLLAAALLAALHPAAAPGQARPACRAGLFDCSLPTWSASAWQDVPRWPVRLASLVMLPMMCSLALMPALCRGGALSGQAMLALHFAAMFLPACGLGRRRVALTADVGTALCAALLGAGALVLVVASGDLAWALAIVLQGTAWSLAWSIGLGEHAPARNTAAAPLPGALLNALGVLALGGAVERLGLQAVSGVHVALGLAAWLAWSAARARQAWRLHRQNAAFRQGPTAV